MLVWLRAAARIKDRTTETRSCAGAQGAGLPLGTAEIWEEEHFFNCSYFPLKDKFSSLLNTIARNSEPLPPAKRDETMPCALFLFIGKCIEMIV